MQNDSEMLPLPTVLPTLEQLRQKVFDEELLSKTVDVDNVATEFLTAFLSAVEGRCFIDDCVTRSFLATAGELGPPRSIYATRHQQMTTMLQDAGWSSRTRKQLTWTVEANDRKQDIMENSL